MLVLLMLIFQERLYTLEKVGQMFGVLSISKLVGLTLPVTVAEAERGRSSSNPT